MQPVRVEELLWSPGQDVTALDAVDAQHDQSHAVEVNFGLCARLLHVGDIDQNLQAQRGVWNRHSSFLAAP